MIRTQKLTQKYSTNYAGFLHEIINVIYTGEHFMKFIIYKNQLAHIYMRLNNADLQAPSEVSAADTNRSI